MAQFEIPGFLPGRQTNNTDQARLDDKLQMDAQPQIGLRPGFERIPTQLPGDRWDPRDVTGYRANSGMVMQFRQAKESIAYIESQTTRPLPPGAQGSPTTGSGFVATADGRVVTGYHVVKDAKPGSLNVTLPNGKKYQAEVEYLDQKTELAVLRLLRQPNETFKPLAMAENSDLKPGDKVSAMGYPRGVKEVFLSMGGTWRKQREFESPSQFAQDKMFIAADGSGFVPGGFMRKVTLGSMLFDKDGRERIQGGLLPGEDPNRLVISTNLKVEPGNSGGPLLNQEFKAIGVIGMTDVIGSKAASTPIEDVRAVLAAAGVDRKPNLPAPARSGVYDQPVRFPFLQPNVGQTGSLSNKVELNSTSSTITNLQYRLRDKLAPYR